MAKANIDNRKARYDYFFIDNYTAGIQLFAPEVKAIEKGKVTMLDSFCYFKGGELFVKGLIITASGSFIPDPKRDKKLLLKKRELRRIQKEINPGITIIPKKLFSNARGIIKLEISISKGKKDYDKRNTIKERDLNREMRSY